MTVARQIYRPIQRPITRSISQIGVGSGGPAIAVEDQAVTFGALTLASAGGWAPAASRSISSATIDSGNGSGHWQIASDGTITPSSSGDTANLNAGPYSLVCTFTDSAGHTDTATISITIESGAFYVSAPGGTSSQLEAAAESTSAAYGNKVKLRTGIYNESGADFRIRRGVAPTGTLTQPTDFAYPNTDQGPDLSTANYFTIEPADGATPVIRRMSIDGTDNQDGGICLKGLTFLRTATDNQTANYLLEFRNAVNNCAVWDCTFESTDNDSTPLFRYGGFRIADGCDQIKIVNPTFRNVHYGFSALGRCDNLDIILGEFDRIWYDCIQITDGDNRRVNWNMSYNKRVDPADPDPHTDFIQVNMSAVARDVTGLRIVGNRAWRGDAAVGMVDHQAIFVTGPPSNTINGYYEAGNMGLITFGRGGSVTRATSAIQEFNTYVCDRTDPSSPTEIFNQSGSGGHIRYNVTNQITNTSSATETGNYLVDETASSGDTSYESNFVDPQSGAGVTDLSAQYALKVGGPAYLLSPRPGAAGSGRVDYTNRKINTYIPHRVVFDGTNDMQQKNVSAGTTDGTDGFMIGRFKLLAGDGAAISLADIVPARVQIRRQATNKLEIAVRDAGGVYLVRALTASNVVVGTGEFIVAASWSLVSTPIFQLAFCQVGSPLAIITPSFTVSPTAGTVDYTRSGVNSTIGALSNGTEKTNMEVGEFLLDMSRFVDLSSSTIQQRIVDANGLPIRPKADGSHVSGFQPHIFFGGDDYDAADWNAGTCLGTLTGWTMAGAVADV